MKENLSFVVEVKDIVKLVEKRYKIELIASPGSDGYQANGDPLAVAKIYSAIKRAHRVKKA